MLVLFDIDGTLLKSQHAGVHAMLAAFHQLHPDRRIRFDGVDIAGRLDTLIYDEMTQRHGVPGDAQSHEVFRHTYTGHLERRLAEQNTVIALDGVIDLVIQTPVVPVAETAVGVLLRALEPGQPVAFGQPFRLPFELYTSENV